jgi:hypothetical protein
MFAAERTLVRMTVEGKKSQHELEGGRETGAVPVFIKEPPILDPTMSKMMVKGEVAVEAVARF